MKKALLVVSFGTAVYQTREKTIGAVEKDLKQAFPEHDFFRAFTSATIIEKIRQQTGESILTPVQMLASLKAQGYREVLIQPTHVTAGAEYEKIYQAVETFKNDFIALYLGAPLLTCPQDFKAVGRVLVDAFNRRDGDEALLLMAHAGSNACLTAARLIEACGADSIYVAANEGEPTFERVLKTLREKQYRKIVLSPFMLSAGRHALRDMTGTDTSWQRRLEREGFETERVLKGLGEYPAVRGLYVRHAADAKSVSGRVRNKD